MNKLNILIADDHEVIRDGIIMTLNQSNLANKLYEAENGRQALSRCREYKDIDIVLLDVNMPDMDGIEAAQKIKDQFPDIELIALSMRDDEDSVRDMLKAGVSGYVLKSAGKADIIQSIEKISLGETFYSQDLTLNLIENNSKEGASEFPEHSTELSDREIEILRLIVDEYTNQEIAEKLYISKRTVDTHRTNLLNKTDSKNTAGLVRYALRNDLA